MNREIKFRAWDTDNNVFVDCKDHQIRQIGNDYGGLGNRFVYMQFTGLKDKNGTDIYEGDVIFNSNKTLITCKEDKRVYLAKWQEGKYDENNFWLRDKPGFIFKKIKFNGLKYMDLVFNQSEIKIVGNLYENPEFKELD